jgi:hypothetical protein
MMTKEPSMRRRRLRKACCCCSGLRCSPNGASPDRSAPGGWMVERKAGSACACGAAGVLSHSGRAWEAKHGVQAVGAQVGVPREAAPLNRWMQRQRGGGATAVRGGLVTRQVGSGKNWVWEGSHHDGRALGHRPVWHHQAGDGHLAGVAVCAASPVERHNLARGACGQWGGLEWHGTPATSGTAPCSPPRQPCTQGRSCRWGAAPATLWHQGAGQAGQPEARDIRATTHMGCGYPPPQQPRRQDAPVEARPAVEMATQRHHRVASQLQADVALVRRGRRLKAAVRRRLGRRCVQQRLARNSGGVSDCLCGVAQPRGLCARHCGHGALSQLPSSTAAVAAVRAETPRPRGGTQG